MKRRLIIQLARFGDLMQTAPLVSAAVGKSDPEQVHLLVDSSLESTAHMIEGVAEVHTIDRGHFARELAANRLSSAALLIKNLIDRLNSVAFDIVTNITHTAESAYLSSLVQAKEHQGLIGSRHGNYSTEAWSRLFRATLPRRSEGVFHLIDLHRKIAGLGTPSSEDSWLKTKDSFVFPDQPAGPILTIQPGANNPLRMWPVAHFASVVSVIKKQIPTLTVALVGSKSEKPLAAEFLQYYSHQAIDLVGKTTLEELAGVIAGSTLVLSGDTGTIHLAAALQIQTAGIYLGMARAYDTAPYRSGSLVFEPGQQCYPCPEDHRCGHVSCHKDIPPEAVASALVALLNGGEVEPFQAKTFQLRKVGFDSNHCLELSSWDDIPFREIKRHYWVQEFSPNPAKSSPLPASPETLSVLAITANAITAARQLEAELVRGNSAADPRKNLKLAMTEMEKQANLPGKIGLLCHLFQLEVVNVPNDPLQIIKTIRVALENLARRLETFPDRHIAPELSLRRAV